MNFKISILILILLFSACKKDKSQSNVKVIGHGATGLQMKTSFYHDNSLESINKALETEGCDGIEIDVQLSSSGTLWLFHDPELSIETKSSGCINSKTDEELDQIHYQTIHKEKLIRLADIPFEKLIGKTLMLDLRHYNQCSNTFISSNLILQQLLQFPALQDGSIEVYLITNYQTWMLELENSNFDLIYSAETLSDFKAFLSSINLAGIMIRNSGIDKNQIEELKSQGKKTIIFEVRSPKGIRKALKKNPDYLVTDDLNATIIEK